MLIRLFYIFFCLISFSYGVLVGKYELFPYSQLAQIKDIFEFGFHSTDNYGRITYIAGKTEIKCPKIKEDIGVIIAIGQSNSTNYSEKLINQTEVPDVINWFNNKCYKTSSPLLGGQNFKGDFVSLVAQKLVDIGIYKKVILVSRGVGGSSIKQWTKNGELNKSLKRDIIQLKREYEITEILWHQGETDAYNGMSEDIYEKKFLSLKESIREIGIKAPFFISISSLCGGYENAENGVTRAQKNLFKKNTDIFLGANTDKLVPKYLRYDGCHFNATAQKLVADSYADSIANSYN